MALEASRIAPDVRGSWASGITRKDIDDRSVDLNELLSSFPQRREEELVQRSFTQSTGLKLPGQLFAEDSVDPWSEPTVIYSRPDDRVHDWNVFQDSEYLVTDDWKRVIWMCRALCQGFDVSGPPCDALCKLWDNYVGFCGPLSVSKKVPWDHPVYQKKEIAHHVLLDVSLMDDPETERGTQQLETDFELEKSKRGLSWIFLRRRRLAPNTSFRFNIVSA